MKSSHALPSELTIYTVAETRLAWLSWLAVEGPTAPEQAFAVDATAVQEVDAAGVQLLLALQRSLVTRQQALHLVSPSSALTAACQALGAQSLVSDA